MQQAPGFYWISHQDGDGGTIKEVARWDGYLWFTVDEPVGYEFESFEGMQVLGGPLQAPTHTGTGAIYQTFCTEDDPIRQDFWMDVSQEAYEHLKDKEGVRCRVVYPGPVDAIDWQNDPSQDGRWNAGLDFGQQQLCKFLGVDPDDVTWDAATEELEGDVQAVIGNIMRTKFGDDWAPSDGAIYAAVSRASVTDAEHGDMMRDVEYKLGDLASASMRQCLTDAIEFMRADVRWNNRRDEIIAAGEKALAGVSVPDVSPSKGVVLMQYAAAIEALEQIANVLGGAGGIHPETFNLIASRQAFAIAEAALAAAPKDAGQ